jgi:carboxyvinyl-carboxyphosphonate phosphorylmutase
MKTTTMLRKLIEQDGLIVAPGAFSPLGAMMIQQAGFPCVYMSGYGVAAFRLGYPDVGLMTMTEALDTARSIAAAVDIPVISDVDTGYGNAINVKRTVEAFENAGLAGIQMEDQGWPKRCGHMEGKVLIPAEEMVQKLRMAVNARQDPDFIIIARTDANTVLGFEEAIRRANLYAQAGADIVFFESPTTDEQVRKIPDMIHAPTMINMSEGAKTPLRSNSEIETLGYKLVIWPSSATWAAAKGMQEIYRILKDKGTTQEDLDKLILFHDFNELLGLSKVMDLSRQYSNV